MGIKVLVIESALAELHNQLRTSAYGGYEGVEIIHATTIEQGLKIIEKEFPHLIICVSGVKGISIYAIKELIKKVGSSAYVVALGYKHLKKEIAKTEALYVHKEVHHTGFEWLITGFNAMKKIERT